MGNESIAVFLVVYPLSRDIQSFGIRHHQYIDDTQISIAAVKTDLSIEVSQLENCLNSVHMCLQRNSLQLNPSKSEMIAIQVSDSAIRPSSYIKSLGVTLNSKLTFDQHVFNVCKAATSTPGR
jgi:hypothetical protein